MHVGALLAAIIAGSLAVICPTSARADDLIVETDAGRVQGVRLGTIDRFLEHSLRARSGRIAALPRAAAGRALDRGARRHRPGRSLHAVPRLGGFFVGHFGTDDCLNASVWTSDRTRQARSPDRFG